MHTINNLIVIVIIINIKECTALLEGFGRFLSFVILHTVGRTPRTTYTQDDTNAEETLSHMDASSRIRTHNPSIRAGKNSYCDRRTVPTEQPLQVGEFWCQLLQ
jgi:hypothetical protein